MSARGDWLYRSLTECLQALGPRATPPDDGQLYCNATWDDILCWPSTPAGETVQQPCPPLRGLDQRKFGFKTCDPEGRWEGRYPGETLLPQGWTNYSDCYTDEAKAIYRMLFSHGDSSTMKRIGQGTRIMETVGLTLSFASLLLSILLLCYFRNLRCNRTRIHRNLFIAMLIHVTIELVTHIDWYVARSSGEVAGVGLPSEDAILNTRIVCEVLVSLVEYTKTAVLFWMFIEGMYLHNMLAVTVFSAAPNYTLYYFIGWGLPFLITSVWVTVQALTTEPHTDCWFLYHFRSTFWIITGTRAAVITVNMLFLLNIIRVLVTKLRATGSTEVLQVKKAVKAAVVLLPLLGFNCFLDELKPPLGNLVKYAIVSYIQHFLFSFQGFVIALLYCFLNEEVRCTVAASWLRYKQTRGNTLRRRTSGTISFSVTEMVYQQTRVDEICFLNGHKRMSQEPLTNNHADSNVRTLPTRPDRFRCNMLTDIRRVPESTNATIP